jgi:hypothetical protein
MAITLVGTASGGNISGNNAIITLPAGMAQDDIVLVIGGTGNDGTPAAVTTSGYTSLDTSASSQVDLNASWKRMGVSPDTTVTCNGGGNAADAVAYVAMVFRGIDTTTAIDATTITNSGTGDPNSNSITTVTNGAAVVTCFISEDTSSPITAPTGYGDKVDEERSDANPVQVGAAWKAVATAGAENPIPWNTSFAAGANYIAYTIALRPAIATTAVDGVFSATGTANVSLIGSVGANMMLNATGTGTASWTGTALGITGALAATGTATVAFEGEGGGWGSFAMTPTVTVSWVGGKEYMSSVREVISGGAASVTVH